MTPNGTTRRDTEVRKPSEEAVSGTHRLGSGQTSAEAWLYRPTFVRAFQSVKRATG